MKYSRIKKWMVIFLSLFAAICLSGCMQVVLKVDIHQDGGGTLETMIGIQEQYYDMATETDGSDPFQQVIDSAKNEEGITASEYRENGYRGVRIKQNVQNLMTLSQMGSATEDLTENLAFSITEENGKQVYSISGKADIQSALDDQGISKSQLLAMGDSFDMRFVVTFPYPVTEHNGTEISGDGRTVTWDLVAFEEETLHATAVEDGSGFGSILLIVLLVMIILLIGVVLWNILRKKKKQPKASAGQKASTPSRRAKGKATASRLAKSKGTGKPEKKREAALPKATENAVSQPGEEADASSGQAQAQPVTRRASAARPSLSERLGKRQQLEAEEKKPLSAPDGAEKEEGVLLRRDRSKGGKKKKAPRKNAGFARKHSDATAQPGQPEDIKKTPAQATQPPAAPAKQDTAKQEAPPEPVEQRPNFSRKKTAANFGYASKESRKGARKERGKAKKEKQPRTSKRRVDPQEEQGRTTPQDKEQE